MDINDCPNMATYNAVIKCERYLSTHKNISVSISGGADSDIMLDLIERVLKDKAIDYTCNIHYVFFDTGIEYQATKRHLDYLEDKYGIKIERVKSKGVAWAVREIGYPFLTKDVSGRISDLQRHNFDFAKDGGKPYEELLEIYPKCKSAIKWWCCKYISTQSITHYAYLKEFLINNPPQFKISQRCCNISKKDVSNEYCKQNDIDLVCVGLRKAEGGVRALYLHNCYTERLGGTSTFRPLFYFTNEDKQEYEDFYGIKHSDCYEVWGMNRTGCAGCPFNSRVTQEISLIYEYEPKLVGAVSNIFQKSHEYTKAYKEYREAMKNCDKRTSTYNKLLKLKSVYAILEKVQDLFDFYEYLRTIVGETYDEAFYNAPEGQAQIDIIIDILKQIKQK